MKERINPKNGDRLSALGFGCMRFPRSEKEAEALVIAAVEKGVNYFDTAYIYPGNEAVLGRILERNGLRDRIRLATKIPQYLVGKNGDLDKFFSAQLEHLKTHYIDYYLMHMLTEASQWDRLVSLGVREWIAEKKAAGEILNIGFSYHGGKEEFVKIVDGYDWDFCMIQYNYLDEHTQAGKSGLEYASAKGLPVMIMEPLRGGRLAVNLPSHAAALWEKAPGGRTPAEWGLRWVWNHPQVTTVLSGMNTMEMLEENIRVAGEAEPQSLTDAELALFENAREIILDSTRVPCTGCGYCMPCPFGVDIPLCFTCYNNTAFKAKVIAQFNYITYAGEHNASKCKACGKCESHCPQHIPIREKLRETAAVMEGFPYRPMRFFAKKIMRRG